MIKLWAITKKIKLHHQIFIGLILGVLIGLIFAEKASAIKPIGTIFLNLIIMIVVPLVFVSLMLGTASLGDIRKLGRIGLKTLVYFTLTTMVAAIIGLAAANIFKPGVGLDDKVKADLHKNFDSGAQVGIQRMEEKPKAIDILINIVTPIPSDLWLKEIYSRLFFWLFFLVPFSLSSKKSEPNQSLNSSKASMMSSSRSFIWP